MTSSSLDSEEVHKSGVCHFGHCLRVSSQDGVGPESLPKMAATPEPPAIMDVKPQYSVIRDATSVFPVIVNVLFEDTQTFHMHFRLVSSGPTAGFGQSSRHPTLSSGHHRDCSPILSAPCVFGLHSALLLLQSPLQPMVPLQSPFQSMSLV